MLGCRVVVHCPTETRCGVRMPFFCFAEEWQYQRYFYNVASCEVSRRRQDEEPFGGSNSIHSGATS